MKTATLMMIILTSMTLMAAGNSTVENALPNLERALNSDNHGVVESAIFMSAKLKLFYPQQNTESLEKLLDNLTDTGETETIRYKAYLAFQFMTNATSLANIEKEDYKASDQFFRLLADEKENRLLAQQ